MDNGEDPLNLEEVKAFGRLVSGGNEIKIQIKKLHGSMDFFIGLQRIWIGDQLLQPLTAILSSEHPHYQASKCIDGDLGGWRIAHINMCSTNCYSKCQQPQGRLPWLALDYGTLVTVKRVEIFSRSDCCGPRTRNVDVRVSNHLPTSDNLTFSGGPLFGHFAGPASNGQHMTHSQMLGKFEYTGGPIFKVVLEC